MGDAKRKADAGKIWMPPGTEASAELRPALMAPRIVREPLGYVILHATRDIAWNGSRWVLKGQSEQVLNFDTADEAFSYLKANGKTIKGAEVPPMPAAELPPVTEPTEADLSAAEPFSIARLTAAGPNHWPEPMPDPGAFRCPHCGAWRPGYGFNGQHATMPGMGLVDYVTMYCGECRVIVQVQILAMDPAGVGGRGFRTH